MKIEVRDQEENPLGHLLLAVLDKKEAPVKLRMGEKALLDRIDTPEGFYYALKTSYVSLKDLTEFTPS